MREALGEREAAEMREGEAVEEEVTASGVSVGIRLVTVAVCRSGLREGVEVSVGLSVGAEVEVGGFFEREGGEETVGDGVLVPSSAVGVEE